MKTIAYSINGVPIRLTDERWAHIARNKPYMLSYRELVLETIERPTWVLRGLRRGAHSNTLFRKRQVSACSLS
jgi:hypothetical protein